MSPSEGASSPTTLIPLTLRSEDASDELYLIDAHFNLVKRAFGTLEALVGPGVYKVKVRAGEDSYEEHVVVRPGDTAIEKRYPRRRFASAAPLEDTGKTHEYHIVAAQRESRVEHVTAGEGSWIFVMARHWSQAGAHALGQGRDHPAAGLTLQRIDVQASTAQHHLTADLATQSTGDSTGDPWCACNVRLDPGPYALTLQLPSGRVFRHTLIAAPGWQTQVFLLQRFLPEEKIYRPDLLESAIFMSRGMGFDTARRDHRIAEQGRHALMNQRSNLREEITRMLQSKVDDPMLGLVGAHLLLDQPTPETGLIRMIVEHLRVLLNVEHPDVEALALALPDDAGRPGEGTSLRIPPMLRRSWELVVHEAARNPRVVPEGSLADAVCERLWGPSAWLVWEEQARTTSDAESQDEPDVDLVLQSALRSYTRRKARTSGHAMMDVAMARAIASTEGGSRSLLSRAASAAERVVARVANRSEPAVTRPGLLVDEIQAFLDDHDAVSRLARAMVIPRHKLEQRLHGLANHFAERHEGAGSAPTHYER